MEAEIQDNLLLLKPRNANLLSTSNWETCNYDGSFSLLPMGDKDKINKIYTKIKNYNYEAMVVAKWRDEYNKATEEKKDEIGRIWRGFTVRLNGIADDLQIDLKKFQPAKK